MTSMVERCTGPLLAELKHQLSNFGVGDDDIDAKSLIKVVIAAMREPTKGMVERVDEVMGCVIEDREAKQCWRLMLDAALAEVDGE